MYKIILALFLTFGISHSATADISEYRHSFDVKMDMDLSNLYKYIIEMQKTAEVYNKGYTSRFEMGNRFNKEFSRVIKAYGSSESRIKTSYEDELLDLILMLPKEMYQYIGPMLHEIPTMPEKILNLPGIKETKNKFPEEIAEKYKGMENIEALSPALYIALMPQMWEKKKNLDKPANIPSVKPKKPVFLPDYLKEKNDSPVPQAQNKPASAKARKTTAPADMTRRTLYPSLTSPLTTKDAEAVMATWDKINEWGKKGNDIAVIRAGILLDMMEQDGDKPLRQPALKDMVNPCQNLVLKTRIAGIYHSFSTIVAQEGFTPEEWAYTCDKTLKAFRAANANHSMALAIRFHRRGYYEHYYRMLPQKWQESMRESEAALVAMYSVLREDVEAVSPIREKIRKKLLENGEMLLITPIIY